MPNFRLLIEKKPEFQQQKQSIQKEISEILHLPNTVLKMVELYDVFDIEEAQFEQFCKQILIDQVSDQPINHFDANTPHIAYEALPGQFDARADAAKQCFQLLFPNSSPPKITTASIVQFDQLNDKQQQTITNYLVNPVEKRVKAISAPLELPQVKQPEPIPAVAGFIDFSSEEMEEYRASMGFALSLPDLLFIQSYFKNEEEREPVETELRVLDTYWSDHCRHTTFLSVIDDVEFEEGPICKHIKSVYDDYLTVRKRVYGDRLPSKPVCLMDLATLAAKDLKQRGILTEVEESEEINACSVYTKVQTEQGEEDWLLMFKNETHNHPTEIEPFGGASTCLGGCIRDPLSGRAYVYQAMRVSGAANPLEPISDTLAGKLPQQKISKEAALGFSSYGNQIGLATTQVSEIYHPGYKAKRMEVGAVVAAAPADWVRRESPEAGDVIILLGGKTGRDGVGGATGSSKEHNEDSLETAGSEVQKGNPPEERKIQRFFRNPEVTKLIKKCNDFGAGGVSVAIGELADGLIINLDAVPTKYEGLNGTELALSESQERMAVVISKHHQDEFVQLAQMENLEASHVADVTEEARLVMSFQGQTIVDISRSFIDTNGLTQHTTAKIVEPKQENYSEKASNSIKEQLLQRLQQPEIASQQGLVEQFDSSIGSSTVQSPFGGFFQKTPAEGSIQLFPTLTSDSKTASAMTWGYDPYLSSWSPFHGGSYAVIESMAKLVCLGAAPNEAYFTFQEYFKKLGTDSRNWGLPLASLLGAFEAQEAFECVAIGGKDSMSGSFQDIHVPPTLISFAVAALPASQSVSNDLKSNQSNLYLLKHKPLNNQLPNYKQITQNFNWLNEQIRAGKVLSAGSIGTPGIAIKLAQMCFGNHIGIEMTADNIDYFESSIGSIIIESEEEIQFEHLRPIGKTNTSKVISIGKEAVSLEEALAAWEAPLEQLFPTKTTAKSFQPIALQAKPTVKYTGSKSKPHVFIPAFPGTNCEYDSKRAFEQAGASTSISIFRNNKAEWIQESLNEFEKQIKQSQILMLSGGFSAGDEPDGSGKFIAAVLRNQQIRDAIEDLLQRDGLILGICNGFQALVKSGLLPFGSISNQESTWPTLGHNEIGRHISQIVRTKVVANHSPWLQSYKVGEQHQIAISHGEGRFRVSDEFAEQLFEQGQVATQYVDIEGKPTLLRPHNPNGSYFAIEGITSPNGKIFGKMGHSERMGKELYQNFPEPVGQNIFKNGVDWFQ